MDAERRKEQAGEHAREHAGEQPYESVSPQFVWELELEHTKPVAKSAKAAAKPAPATTAKAVQPAKVARPNPAPRLGRRKVLLPVLVVVAVIAGSSFAILQLNGHGEAAKSGTRAAEAGSAEYPQAAIPAASANSSYTSHKTATPTRHASTAPAHHSPTSNPGTTASTSADADSATVKTSSAPATKASSAAPAVVAHPASTVPTVPSVVEALAGQWGQCALLNGSCSVSLPSVVALGANGYFNYGTFENATTCSYSVFGNPNASGQIACYDEPTPTASSDVWTECAAENGTCSYSGVMTIAFGANGDYHYATLGGGGTACTDTVFGDPDYNTPKACYLMAPPPQFTHWDLCATNGATCKFSGTQEVAYGAAGRYKYGSYTTSTPCTESALGNPEASGTMHCYVQDYYQY